MPSFMSAVYVSKSKYNHFVVNNKNFTLFSFLFDNNFSTNI